MYRGREGGEGRRKKRERRKVRKREMVKVTKALYREWAEKGNRGVLELIRMKLVAVRKMGPAQE